MPALEGTRPLMLEIQALTSPAYAPVPRRVANGVDYNRLLMLAAVASRRSGLELAGQDIIVNVAGGFRVSEPAADLGILLALASSLYNQPLDPQLVAIGEVGLSGELRTVPQIERRITEAAPPGPRALHTAGNGPRRTEQYAQHRADLCQNGSSGPAHRLGIAAKG